MISCEKPVEILPFYGSLSISRMPKNQNPEADSSKTNSSGTTDSPIIDYGSVSDIDGNIYKTIQIGNRTWMAENLKTTTYNDGNKIYFCPDGGPAGYTLWFGLGKGAYCWYDNDPSQNKDLGAFYNWHAVNTDKLCPAGWHVPSYSEWESLITFLGGKVYPFSEQTDNARVNIQESIIEKSGFNPGTGHCLCGWGFIEYYPYWWTSNSYIKYNFPYAYLIGFEYISDEPQSYGFNVRCLKD
ncbi:MAG: fibrobacter succinogenes major paralogous domain-containing protein [Bacteroidales bacterium]|nr:fibrobacter succinogenes major paralogous domain-containing protein [Bacteroidales bacterium]